MPPVTHLLYLHGFRSSPRSAKAQAMAQWIQAQRPDVHWACPQLPPSPAQAMALIEARVQDWPADRSAVVGSSLGGFYATVWAERQGWRAVVLNPAVHPDRDLARHLGEQTHWHDEQLRFTFDARHIDELTAMKPGPPRHPERIAAVIAQGDELLDWHEMSARYQGATIRLLDGSDHALSDFVPDDRDFVLRWLGLLSAA